MRTLQTLLLCMLTAVAAAAPDNRTPEQVVQQTADTLASRIEGRQEQLGANPTALYELVGQVFLPVFDTDYAGRLVLGKHWRSITPAQRQEFVETFYDFMLRSYSRYVLRFEKDKVRILPGSGGPTDPQHTVVKTEMQLADGTKVPVHYSLRRTDDGWRAFDVRVEGISYVQNYRNQFNAEIGANGIDAVIARLKSDTAKLTTNTPAKGG